MDTAGLEWEKVRLLNGEQIEYTLETGTKHGQLALTNKRVMSWAKVGRSTKITVALIRDIDLVEIKHLARKICLLIFGILLTPVLIGIVLLIMYFRSGHAQITFKTRGTEFSGQFKRSKVDEVYTVMRRFFELKEK